MAPSSDSDSPPQGASPFRSPQTTADAPGENRPAEPERPNDLLRGWLWIPSLYFAEGLPYVMVMTVAVIMYKDLGFDNDTIAYYTSLLYLPWVIKPLWSPLIDVFGTQRRWILLTQIVIAAGFFGVAFALASPSLFMATLGFFWILAFSSATHDIAADGFYMAGISKKAQTWFVGIRSTFYRVSMIAGQGGLVMLAGWLEKNHPPAVAWRWTLMTAGGVYATLAIYHLFALPRPTSHKDESATQQRNLFGDLLASISTFFSKPGIPLAVAFLLLYRFAESQLAKLASPFLMDSAEAGGLGLDTAHVGTIYGTAGVLMLTIGGILGGLVAARHGLRRWLLPMAAAINLPNAVYVFLAFTKPTSLVVIGSAVAVEQFGYGFGFAAYLLVMLEFSRGKHETAHYALCTGLMALGMMLPGMFCGKLQLWLGYEMFFVWILIATIPSFLVTLLVRKELVRREIEASSA